METVENCARDKQVQVEGAVRGMDVDAYLQGLSDADLKTATAQAYEDLGNAADTANNTPWHDVCFAALVTYCREATRRGIKWTDLLTAP